jgi:hypothetical protein
MIVAKGGLIFFLKIGTNAHVFLQTYFAAQGLIQGRLNTSAFVA